MVSASWCGVLASLSLLLEARYQNILSRYMYYLERVLKGGGGGAQIPVSYFNFTLDHTSSDLKSIFLVENNGNPSSVYVPSQGSPQLFVTYYLERVLKGGGQNFVQMPVSHSNFASNHMPFDLNSIF